MDSLRTWQERGEWRAQGDELTVEGRTDNTGNVRVTLANYVDQPDGSGRRLSIEIPVNEWETFLRLLESAARTARELLQRKK